MQTSSTLGLPSKMCPIKVCIQPCESLCEKKENLILHANSLVLSQRHKGTMGPFLSISFFFFFYKGSSERLFGILSYILHPDHCSSLFLPFPGLSPPPRFFPISSPCSLSSEKSRFPGTSTKHGIICYLKTRQYYHNKDKQDNPVGRKRYHKQTKESKTSQFLLLGIPQEYQATQP